MLKGSKLCRSSIVLALILFCSSAWPQYPLDSESREERDLFSPSAAQRFYEIACELANEIADSGQRTADSKKLNANKIEQAIIFLTATTNLDSRANYVLPDMIKLTCQRLDRNHSEMMHHLLANYVDESANLEVLRKAVWYLLEQLNSREEREKLLEEMLARLGGKNKAFDSELATLLGLLTAEKADLEAAQSHLMYAFNSNKYNKLAFTKLAELAGEQIEPAIRLEHLRLALGENPAGLEAALTFAQYAEQLQLYQVAADSYKYTADLFSYLYPSQPLPTSIYLPWALSNYNTQRNQHKCLEIAKSVRQSGRFDLLLEAIAGKAAAKIGDTEQANRIFQAAEEKINNQSSIINNQSIAWFYCFALPDADSAVDWANKAYSIEPNSPTAAAILAYSLLMNGQTDWAKLLTDNYEHNQIATLALAQIQLAQEQRDLAIETLKSAIAKDPGSLVAERAKEILAQHGGEHITPIAPDIILTVLRNSFGQAVVPTFVRPEKIISVQLNVRGINFPYGSKFGGSVAITNNSSEPLIVSDDSLFRGNIRIDANVTGDLNKKIPNLVSVKIQPALPIKPGASMLIPLRLITAELRQLLFTYPQASLDIEFTAYLDPVTTDQGKIANRLRDIKPATVTVKRPGVELTGKYLRNRFNSLSKGRQGQKIKTAQLFIGLLMEQNAMANREPFYKFMYADWMPALLKSALVHNLTDDDWVAKVHTMAWMLSLPLDYELINATAENLNDTHWPVRLTALYLLARAQDSNFGKVLDWSAKYDSSKLVRDMAIALGAAVPEPAPEPEPQEQPRPAGEPQEQP